MRDIECYAIAQWHLINLLLTMAPVAYVTQASILKDHTDVSTASTTTEYESTQAMPSWAIYEAMDIRKQFAGDRLMIDP